MRFVRDSHLAGTHTGLVPSWPRDRFDVAALLLQYWWVVAGAWICGATWVLVSIHRLTR
jgi:hypothetical protein